jgi:hypothetical protein
MLRSMLRARNRPGCLALCCVLALLVAAPAGAKHGGAGDDVRASVTCTAGATAALRLRARDGAIEVELEVKRRRGVPERWRVVLVHERRVAWRATVRATRSRAFRVRRSIAELDGPDRVTARATGPGGAICEASATLTE